VSEQITFVDWLAQKLGTSRWVVAHRLTPRLRAKYDLAVSEKKFDQLEAEYKAIYGLLHGGTSMPSLKGCTVNCARFDGVDDGYKTDDMGRITSPGKFEGEMYYIPELWDLVLEGGADEEIGDYPTYAVFVVDADLLKKYPEITREVAELWLYEDDNGFVRSHEFNKREAKEFRKAIEEEEEAVERGGFDGHEDEELPEDEEEVYEESNEPVEGDWVTADHKDFYEVGREHKGPVVSVKDDASHNQMVRALKAAMKKQNWFPTVWFVSDHGNAHMMDLKEERRK
jgi:hypothetical protein